MMSTKMYALVTTDQGTAMSETGLCGDCYTEEENRGFATEQAFQADDFSGDEEFTDVSQNELINCIICGAPDFVEPEDRSASANNQH